MNSWVCTDANLVLRLALPQEGYQQARALWQRWRQEGQEIVAPLLLRYEITSVLRNHVYRNLISLEQGRRALSRLLALPISFYTASGLHQLAWELATQLGRPNAYDAHYLALAETLGCEFWTADIRLYNAVKEQLPWVRSVQEAKV